MAILLTRQPDVDAILNNPAAIAALLDADYTVEVLPIAQIGVDHEYQRPLMPFKIAELTPWDMGLAGAFDINLRPDGTYWVMDGQHRLEVARRAGERDVLCLVRRFTRWPEEAAFFVKKNKVTTRPHPVYAFRARLGAGDPICVGINALLTKHGLHINYTQNHADPLGVYCVGTLETLYRQAGPRGKGGSRITHPQRLDRVLTLARLIWGEKHGVADDLILRAVDSLIFRYGDQLDIHYVAARLAHTEPLLLKRQAGERAKMMGMAANRVLAGHLVEIFNHKLKSNRLPPYFTENDAAS